MLKKIKGIEIAGISCCVPNKIVFNKDNKHHNNTTRIIKAIGIETRPIADEKTCTSDLVIKSAKNILKKLKWKNQDIDILTTEDISKRSTIFETHDSELSFHEKVKENLIYNNDLYFEYLGLKFVSFRQLYLMKSNRSTSKDKDDINMMKAFIDGNKFSMFF